MQNRIHLLLREARGDVDYLEMNRRELALDIGQLLHEVVGGVDFAGVGGLLNREKETALAVYPRVLQLRFVAFNDVRDFADARYLVARRPRIDASGKTRDAAVVGVHLAGSLIRGCSRTTRNNRQVFDLLNRLDVAAHVDDRLTPRLVRVTARHAAVLLVQRIDDVVDREVARRELRRIDFDLVCRRDGSSDARVGDAGNLLDLRNDDVVRVKRELAGRQLR